jgi:exosortase
MAVKGMRSSGATRLAERSDAERAWPHPALLAVVVLFLVALYYHPMREMMGTWALADSYYSHGYLVPFISAFLLWKDRARHRGVPIAPSPALGYSVLAAAVLLLLVGDLLGFGIFTQLSMLPMITALVLLIFGVAHFRAAWFPIWFLFFMIPIPPSLTASISLHLKLMATDGAVRLAQLFYLPIVQSGSYVLFKEDQLLVGDVCGGLRSLIALLALGALMSYVSRNRPWARVGLLVLAPPIAIATNILRIFALCVIAYHWGSPAATGLVHDISGFMIFVVALIMFFGCDIVFSWLSRRTESRKSS